LCASLSASVHAALLLDGASWDVASDLVIRANLSLLLLPQTRRRSIRLGGPGCSCASATSRSAHFPTSAQT
jgi:hypothetical protein